MNEKAVLQKSRLGLKFSARDLLVLKIIAPIVWVFMGYATYLAFAKGQVGEGVAHGGFLVVLFCGLIHLLGIADTARDPVVSKLTAIATLLGLLVCATGWTIRLMT